MDIKFLEKAVSKDQARFSLTKIYRDTEFYSATDGHRMHICKANIVDKPFYLDGTDDWQYPDLKPLIASVSHYQYLSFKCDVKAFKHFKSLLNNLKLIDKEYPVKMTFKDKSLFIESNDNLFKFSLKLGEFSIDYDLPEMVTYINAKYLFDGFNNCQFCQLGFENNLKPIVINHADSICVAYLMPMRLPKNS